MPSLGEALKAEDLPSVVEAGLMGSDKARPRSQVFRPPVFLGQEEMSVGCARVKGQRTSVCKDRDWYYRQIKKGVDLSALQ